MDYQDALYEAAYSRTLEAVAMGATKSETRADILRTWPTFPEHQLDSLLREVLRDALAQGVEREDVDPSWFWNDAREREARNAERPNGRGIA